MIVYDKAHTDLHGFALHSTGYKTPGDAWLKGRAIDKRNNGVSFKIVRVENGLSGKMSYQLYVESLYFS